MANRSKVHPWRKDLNSYNTGNCDIVIVGTYIVEMQDARKRSRKKKPMFEELIPCMGEEAIDGYLFCDFDDLILKESIASAKIQVNDMISAIRALGVRLGALSCLGVSGMREIKAVTYLKEAYGFRGYVYVIDVSNDEDRRKLMDFVEDEGLCLKQPAQTPTPKAVQIHEIGAVYWMRLPNNLIACFLSRVGAFELLENAQLVCKKWYKICKEPIIWRSIDMSNGVNILQMSFDVLEMAKEAINRSSG